MGQVTKVKTLEELAADAISSVEAGYYDVPLVEIGEKSPKAHGLKRTQEISRQARSIVHSILHRKNGAIIAEIKFSSPSLGQISTKLSEVSNISRQMESGGAAGLSVLTEHKNFGGSLDNLIKARESTSLPIMMKDIIVSEEQIEAGARIGASAILLIEEIFSERYSRKKLSLDEAVKFAKEKHLEVIVESNTIEGLIRASDGGCDILGINNRDLKTFRIDVQTTAYVLQGFSSIVRSELRDGKIQGHTDAPIIMSESGFEKPNDISKLVERLRSIDSITPSAYLIGTSIMQSHDIESATRGFTAILKAG